MGKQSFAISNSRLLYMKKVNNDQKIKKSQPDCPLFVRAGDCLADLSPDQF